MGQVFRAVTLAGVTLIAVAQAQAQVGITLEVGSVTGNRGGTVSVPVIFRSQPVQVGSTQNDLVTAVDPIGGPLRIAANGDGTPRCAVNPSFEDATPSFAFLPGGSRTGVRALVTLHGRILGNFSMLYTCDVEIAADAPLGDQGLPISNVGVTNPDGEELPATGTDGTVTVEAAPTPTPTETPTPRGGGNDDDGCAVVAPAAQASGVWPLLLPAAALLWFRRRNK